MVGNLPAGNNAELKDIKIVVPLKNLSNFMLNLDFLLINSEIELILKWSEDCVLAERVMREKKRQRRWTSCISCSACSKHTIPFKV